MPRPRILAIEGWNAICEVARQRDALPTDQELATKHGVSLGYVKNLMKRARHELSPLRDVPRETLTEHNPTPCQSENAAKSSVTSSDAL